MPHIHTKPGEHDVTVSMAIIRIVNGRPHILLHLHRKLNVLMLAGGHIELNENPWQTVTHELLEETGYEMAQLKILQPNLPPVQLTGVTVHPLPFAVITVDASSDGSHMHDDLNYAFLATDEPLTHPTEGESQDLRWLSLDDLRALDQTEIFENVRELCIYVMTTVLELWVPTDLQV